MSLEHRSTIGFIGQGYVGKAYADAIEALGHDVVRYALEEPYVANKDRIKECDIVFIAVPTPTNKKGFDGSIVEESLGLVKKGATAVIKSTILPGMTRALQKKFPRIHVMHSPEFLVARTALQDAANPKRSVIGIVRDTPEVRARAEAALAVLPRAPYERIVSAEEAELIKYGNNFFLFLKVVYGNLMYESARALGAKYDTIREVIGEDARIGHSHLQVVHDSGHRGAKEGRGAGGLCFIKDVEALRVFYATRVRDDLGAKALGALINKNVDLLLHSKKDLDLLASTYPEYAKKQKRPAKKSVRKAVKKRKKA